VMEKKRSTFPTRIKTLDGEGQATTEAELDRMLFDIVKRWCTPTPDPEPNRAPVPTNAELRAQARELGVIPPPPREGSAEWFREDMLRLLG
jgi:hypothetical protein